MQFHFSQIYAKWACFLQKAASRTYSWLHWWVQGSDMLSDWPTATPLWSAPPTGTAPPTSGQPRPLHGPSSCFACSIFHLCGRPDRSVLPSVLCGESKRELSDLSYSAAWAPKVTLNSRSKICCEHVLQCKTRSRNDPVKTLFSQFLLYSKVNQPYKYIYPLFVGFSSHLGHHRALRRVPFATQ